ncbi:helix-turn-helix domain-containing protein, partial [Vibrio anguillarum]
MAIIAPIPRGERRRMKKAIQTTKDKDYARRLIALMQLHEGKTIVDVCRIISAARSSVGRWIDWFTQGGMEA